MALILASKHFEVYVSGGGKPLVVYTDHNPLTFLNSLQNPNQRLMRWCLFLQPFNLDIRHIKGSDNVLTDALSFASSRYQKLLRGSKWSEWFEEEMDGGGNRLSVLT